MSISITASKTSYYRNKVLNVTSGTSITAPATMYLALFVADPGPDLTGSTELSGNAYARQSVAFTTASTINSGLSNEAAQINNSAPVNFPVSSPGAQGTTGGWALYDAATGGNALWHGAWSAPQTITAGLQFQLQVGNLVLQEY